ncbi:MAG: hypothetical protein MUC88_12955 [Planctomycetes bacterium]|jgi:hypothetical protein|nr:hypothetical protein [Planctomycetota bacterium]
MAEVESRDTKPSHEPCVCRIYAGAASEVEILDSFSQAIMRVVETLAPAVVSIARQLTFGDGCGSRSCAWERGWDSKSDPAKPHPTIRQPPIRPSDR